MQLVNLYTQQLYFGYKTSAHTHTHTFFSPSMPFSFVTLHLRVFPDIWPLFSTFHSTASKYTHKPTVEKKKKKEEEKKTLVSVCLNTSRCCCSTAICVDICNSQRTKHFRNDFNKNLLYTCIYT